MGDIITELKLVSYVYIIVSVLAIPMLVCLGKSVNGTWKWGLHCAAFVWGIVTTAVLLSAAISISINLIVL